MYLYHRVYSRFTLEAIVATAFGRQINLQRGESDEFSRAMDTAVKGFASGQFENFALIHSMYKCKGGEQVAKVGELRSLTVYCDNR